MAIVFKTNSTSTAFIGGIKAGHNMIKIYYGFETTREHGYFNPKKKMYTLGKKGSYTPGWCVFFVIISISSVREV